jgi:hypothetical protein
MIERIWTALICEQETCGGFRSEGSRKREEHKKIWAGCVQVNENEREREEERKRGG